VGGEGLFSLKIFVLTSIAIPFDKFWRSLHLCSFGERSRQISLFLCRNLRSDSI
jgi:hypothetical protein